jgi:hypothetical protein
MSLIAFTTIHSNFSFPVIIYWTLMTLLHQDLASHQDAPKLPLIKTCRSSSQVILGCFSSLFAQKLFV